jgi:hypothetical protein
MPVAVRGLVPLAHVKSVPASIDFYRHLGFEIRNTHVPDGGSEPVWAWLASGDAHLMVSAADAPIDREQQAVLFYAYCDDVGLMRDQLIAEGVGAGPVRYPFYSPRGEFRLEDPDGYVVIVAHT